MGVVVFLHGYTGHADSWSEITAAVLHQRPLPLVLWGHDPDANPEPEVITFVEEVDRLTSIIRSQSRDESVILCGYSLGARVALGILVRHPEIASAALLIGVHPGLRTADERRARAEADLAWCRLAEEQGSAKFSEAWEAQPLFRSQSALPPSVLTRQRELRARHSGRALATGMRSLGLGGMPSFWDDLPRVAVPVRLMVGDGDSKFAALAEEMLHALPSASLTVVKDCGHNVVLERPEAVALELRDLCQRT
jgi:2-succinyl-6-hydroxy-2,4-cyclohexadiene-1-carboxylate synthase